jgi:hypothetical protein
MKLQARKVVAIAVRDFGITDGDSTIERGEQTVGVHFTQQVSVKSGRKESRYSSRTFPDNKVDGQMPEAIRHCRELRPKLARCSRLGMNCSAYYNDLNHSDASALTQHSAYHGF